MDVEKILYKTKKYISYLLFAFSFLSAVIGIIIARVRHYSFLSTTIIVACFFVLIELFVLSKILKKPEIFNKYMTATLGCVLFPLFLMTTSRPQIFLLNCLMVPVAYSFGIKTKKDYILPILNLVVLNVCVFIRLTFDYAIIFFVAYSFLFSISCLSSVVLNSINEYLKKENISLIKISLIDELTGLFNRHKLEQYINNGKEYIPIIIDINSFKNLNDSYGHLFGDLVLKKVARCISSIFDEKAISFRFGGDEFLIISQLSEEETKDSLIQLTQKIKDEVKTPIKKSVTVSIGVGQKGQLNDEAISVADKNLYICKNKGCGCIVCNT